jgi:hypothetical protein
MKCIFPLFLLLSLFLVSSSDPDPIFQNPISVFDYGDISLLSWYGWFVIIYSFFVVIIVGSAVFLP